MENRAKKRILLVDPELLSVATTIGALKDDYHVVTAKSGDEIYKQLRKVPVEMVILETRLADTEGFDICRKLKQDEATANLPVVFLTSENSVLTEEKCFAAGADEFITKPFNAPALKARIKKQFKLSNAIRELRRLNQLALDANPNTGLPGNTSILNELSQLVENGGDVSVVYADLDHFKPYNDKYGFAQGDEVIIFTANVIRVAMQLNGCGDSFIGHIGGDDFVMLVPSDKLPAISDEIISRIDMGILEFYSEADASQGYIVANDREGKERQHPLISLSMGAIDLKERKVVSAFEIVDVCTETKKAAKQIAGSSIVVNKRRK